MNVRDWSRYLTSGRGRVLKLAHLSSELTDAVEARSRVVHIHHDYALKIQRKHQLLPQHFPMLDETIDRGRVYLDGRQHLVFFHFDEYVWGRWFRATIKRCNERQMLWVVTFHKSDWSQVRAKHKRLQLLRGPND